jgi:hypothetical protein
MSSESDRRLGNAFTVDFLQRLDEIGEPDGAHEADVAGPWAVRPVLYHGGTGFAVLREWESLRSRREEGAGGAGTGNAQHAQDAPDVPYAVFRRREMALLTAAVLPATGRELLFRLDTEPDADGFPVIASVTPPLTPRRAAPAARGAKAPARISSTPAPPEPPELPETGALGTASNPAAAGHLRDFDEGLAFALHLAAAIVRSPVALAWLLEAAGHVALEQAGRILDQRVR